MDPTLGPLAFLALWAANGGGVAQDADPALRVAADASTAVAIAFMVSMLLMKLTALVLGFMIVKLGHDTVIRGVTGEVDFGFSGSGVNAKLKSASPGAFFILAGAAIMAWALFVEKPFEFGYQPAAAAAEEGLETGPVLRPPARNPPAGRP